MGANDESWSPWGVFWEKKSGVFRSRTVHLLAIVSVRAVEVLRALVHT